MSRLRRFAICLGIVLLVPVSFAALQSLGQPAKDAKAPASEFECRWTDLPIKIDGKGDEAAWKHAQVIDNFYLPWLGKKARPAKTTTKAKLLWDREYLYFFADMEDADLYADVKEHDGMTLGQRRLRAVLQAGRRQAGLLRVPGQRRPAPCSTCSCRAAAPAAIDRFKNDGDFHIEAKVKLRGTLNKWTDKDEGWSVEGRIPWTDFLRTGGRPERRREVEVRPVPLRLLRRFRGAGAVDLRPAQSAGHADFHCFEDYATLEVRRPGEAGTPGRSASTSASR